MTLSLCGEDHPGKATNIRVKRGVFCTACKLGAPSSAWAPVLSGKPCVCPGTKSLAPHVPLKSSPLGVLAWSAATLLCNSGSALLTVTRPAPG